MRLPSLRGPKTTLTWTEDNLFRQVSFQGQREDKPWRAPSELGRDKATKAPFARSRQVGERVVAKAAADGLLLLANAGCVDGVDGDTLALAPPFVVTEADIDEIVVILASAIRSVASGELPGGG